MFRLLNGGPGKRGSGLLPFGFPGEKWSTNKIQTYNKGPGIRVITGNELVIMTRDEGDPKQGFTSQSYLDTLMEGLLPHYSGQEFQQDNAPVHTSGQTLARLAYWDVNVLPNWPPYLSPDMNPIEHIWVHLKQNLYKLCPPPLDWGAVRHDYKLMIQHLPAPWRAFDRRIFDACLESMPRRMEAVVAAQGWQTRY